MLRSYVVKVLKRKGKVFGGGRACVCGGESEKDANGGMEETEKWRERDYSGCEEGKIYR